MKAFVCIIVYYIMFFMSGSVCFAESADLDLHAKAALLLDGDNNRVLFEKNGYEVMAMASTTKIMTCILALEYGKPDLVVEASSYAASMPKVRLGVKAGEKYLLRDLLYSLMLESHNDTAVVIAEAIGGNVEKFADLMNKKAKELGCNDTYFITPNGLDATVEGKTHSTTARDLAVISSYAIQNKELLSIINTKDYTFSNIDGSRNYHVYNKNRFLDMMEGAIGMKTGFTCEAGYCFVGAVKRGDKTFISVVLGCGWPPNKGWKWKDTKKLMEFGLTYYNRKDIYNRNGFGKIKVINGTEDYVDTGKEKRDISLLLCDSDKLCTKYKMPQNIEAPVKKGQIIGYEEYWVNDILYKKIPIVAKKDVKLRDLKYCLYSVLAGYLITV